MEKLSCFTLLLLFCNFCGLASSNIVATYNAPAYANQQPYLLEGCQGASIQLSRPDDMSGSLQFILICSGDASNGIDFSFTTMQWNMTSEQSELTIPLDALLDAYSEGVEALVVDLTCQEDGDFAYHLEVEIRDLTPITDAQVPLEIHCDQDALLELSITGGSGVYTVEWATQELGNPYLIHDPTPGTIAYTITDACSVVEAATGAAEISFIPYPEIEFEVGPSLSLNCTQDLDITIQPTGGNGNYIYQWYINGNLNAYNTSNNFIWNSPTTSEISVVVTDECNSAHVDMLNVLIDNPLPTITIGSDIVGNCLEDVIVNATVVGGLGQSDVLWFYNDLPIGSGQNVTLPIDSGGVLTAEAHDICGSVGTTNVQVFQQPVPIDGLINPIFGMCQDQLSASAIITGGVGEEFSYSWWVQDEMISSGATALVTALPNEMVVLTVNDVCGNIATFETPIILNVQDISVSLNEELLASNCDQDWEISPPAITGGTGNYNFEWHVGDNIDVLSSNEALLLDVTGLHGSYIIVEVSDECTNYGLDSILVQISLPPVHVEVETELSFGCLENILVEPNVSGGAAPYSFSWQIQGTEVGNQEIWTSEATLTQEVICIVTDHCGLQEEITIDVHVLPTNLSAEIIASDDTVCPNQEIELLVNTNQLIGEATFDWSTGNDSEQIAYRANEDQIIQCIVSDVCGNDFIAEFTLTILPSQGTFNVLDDMMLCHGYESGALAEGGYLPYAYSFNSEALAEAENGVKAYGTSEVYVTVSDACGNTGHLTIDARSCDFIIPNVFTPNNDTKNDTFEINGLEKFPKSTLIVFDRDGRKVFESADYKNDWRAEDLPSGQYFYVLRRNDGETFESSVAVIR